MKKFKYRIKHWIHPHAKNFYTAQYRIFGIWMNMNHVGTGRLFKPSSTMCETFQEAKNRIEKFKLTMERAKDIVERLGYVVYETE